MKVAIILGTRPQIIKTAPVIRAATNRSDLQLEIINTGQHYDYYMNKTFFEELKLPDAEIDLEIGPGAPVEQTWKIIRGLGDHFGSASYDFALIPGDTNSALAAGIACSKSGIRIAHLESGARSNDPRMQEELNRRMLDQTSSALMCPTEVCKSNLVREGVMGTTIENIGDTMYDSLLFYSSKINNSHIRTELGIPRGEYAFMTVHRAEITDDPLGLANIFKIAESLPIEIIFAVHPRTKERIERFKIALPRNVKATEPLPYIDTLALIKNSNFVITDSGGLQKEASWLKRPVLILRQNTEWPELITAGVGFLVATDKKLALDAFRKLSEIDQTAFDENAKLFGNGNASEKAIDLLMSCKT
jgi:UDP-N-acetylglucosamine 2-epimerase